MTTRTRTKGLYLHLPSHRSYFAAALGIEDTPMPASLAKRVFGQDISMNTKPVTPLGRITRVEIVDAVGSSIAGHQLVDVYRQNDSRTYPIMNSEPAQRARVGLFVALCRQRGIAVVGEVRA